MSKENNKKDKDIYIGGVSNYFFCKESILINGEGKCKIQCKECIGSENTEYTDTNGHDGSCC